MRIRNSSAVPVEPPSTAPSGAARPSPGAESASSRPVRAPDSVAIAGIPEPELTPRVRDALDRLMAEVQNLRAELAQARTRIAYLEDLADRDPLTPVINRRAFVRELARMIAYAERYGAPGSVIYFDINEMKAINDAHGHAAGDSVLRRVAEILSGAVRASDVVGRLGGDEFGVILAQADTAAAVSKAAALAESLAARAIDWNGIALRVTASYGVYSFAGGEEPDAALDAADRAMYASKARAAS